MLQLPSAMRTIVNPLAIVGGAIGLHVHAMTVAQRAGPL
eukprot:CAMPEP_0206594850 /NCGR_PEP_ID=MMETSP0325_2-20121206/42669_1 /ASSEMBLY_ACC=CAM_ASM_000347 /TAXON_ID=2866 /ORGANISM="Crypthecodinium cohnii, Strain Seligo" /LENGTH=38 /DNA_ID= /DNA_START= /DNA_END= /DNA_ORIENTATION=